MMDLSAIARALGGDIVGSQISAPGPSHSARDRSMTLRLAPSAPGGFVVFSHAGDDFRECRDYIRARLGLARGEWRDDRPPARAPAPTSATKSEDDNGRARWLWRQRKPIVEGSPPWRYLREARGYRGPIPATLGYLPASAKYPPAMIAAFGTATEPEPGLLTIADEDIRGIHLTSLAADGRSKAGSTGDKRTVGTGSSGSPIVLAPVNDLLGLAIVEGVEDGLSVFAATGLGVWAAGPAGRMPALADAIPFYVEHVTIFGDSDKAGIAGATELAARLKARGFEVTLKFLGTEATA